MDEFLKSLKQPLTPLPYPFCNLFVMLCCIVQKNSYKTGLFLGAPLPFWPWWLIPWPYSIEPLQGPAVRISLIVIPTKPNGQLTGWRSPWPAKPNKSDPVPAFRHCCFSPTRTVGPVWNVPKILLPSNAIKHGTVIAWNYMYNFKWKFCSLQNVLTSVSTCVKIRFCLFCSIYCLVDFFHTHWLQSICVWSSVEMADRDVLELANDEEFGDGGMDDMDGEVWSFSKTSTLWSKKHVVNSHFLPFLYATFDLWLL